VSSKAAWAVMEVIPPSAEFLAAAGVDSPRLDAELLLAHVLGCSRLDLYLKFDQPLSDEQRASFRAMLKRRRNREPLQLIVGETEFYGYPLKMKSGVFIPRQETEILVEKTLAALPAGPIRAVEMGTGSGAIPVALTREREDLSIEVSDLSPEALDLAAENAKLNDVHGRVQFVEMTGLPHSENLDLIISNPPYVRLDEADALQPEVGSHDPHAALFAGEDGLDAYRTLAVDAPSRLRPGGLLALEIGATQGEAVRDLLAAAGFESIVVHPDLTGRDRVVMGNMPGRD
jgi:release factor glutamine methyltransferase